MIINKNLFIPSKIRYVRGDKPEVDCILCGVIDRDPKVKSLEIARSDLFCVSANLFPYSPGHLLLFPLRHVEDLRELNEKEALELFRLEKITMKVLDEVYSPHGYNIGYNLGKCGGNSIAHLHLHVVPRFRNELGFMDIISDSRVVVDDPSLHLPRLREAFRKALNQ